MNVLPDFVEYHNSMTGSPAYEIQITLLFCM